MISGPRSRFRVSRGIGPFRATRSRIRMGREPRVKEGERRHGPPVGVVRGDGVPKERPSTSHWSRARGYRDGEELMENVGFAELVDRAGRGEREAALYLIERYESAIRRQVRFSLMDNKLRRVLEETDICQSVMGQFFNGLGAGRFELEGPEQLIGLLKQMVRNKITDEARYWRAGCRDYMRNVSPRGSADPVEPISPQPTPRRVVGQNEVPAGFASPPSEWGAPEF